MLNQKKNQLISIVIPTRNRPELVVRAINSVLKQSYTKFEIIVVIDGKDEITNQELGKIGDPRLKIINLPESGGGANARNQGVNHTKGDWIAFLDDDDEWVPNKLEKQFELAKKVRYKYPIILSRLIYSAPRGEFIFPKRFPSPDEDISDYLLARNSFFQGEGLIQTSMILTTKEILKKVPFRKINRHQEWDWILQASKLAGVGIEFVPEPLVIWYVEEKRKSISNGVNWRNSYDWINSNMDYVTKRAYAGFLMTVVSSIAARERSWEAFKIILFSSIRLGHPKLIDFINFFSMWFIPQEYRHKIRFVLRR